jgi:hypothetical protein
MLHRTRPTLGLSGAPFLIVPLALALAFAPVNAFAATFSCSTVAACALGTNSASGPGLSGISSSGFGVAGTSTTGHGVEGTSAKSFGVVGTTAVNATIVNNARAGVYGEDRSTNGGIYNSGVAGLSSFGIGSLGETDTGVGVEGLAVENGGFVSKPKYFSIGVYGDADQGPGVFGYAHGTTSDSYGVGAIVDEPTRFALYAESDGDEGGGSYALVHSDGYVLEGTSFEHGAVVSIDGNGNEILKGSLTIDGSPLSRTAVSGGGDVTTFGERSSTPTLEDMGEANLVRGAAYVTIDPAFAATMDRSAKYLVFLTPEGDSHGLYVTAQSNRGFAVRENGGARSSLAFNFRIVAKPYATSAARLPALAAPPKIPAMTAPTRPREARRASR